jgi:hypothetical protein
MRSCDVPDFQHEETEASGATKRHYAYGIVMLSCRLNRLDIESSSLDCCT